MKRLIPLFLVLAMLYGCSGANPGGAGAAPTPFEPSAPAQSADGPDEPSLALPPAGPTAAPTHHEEPGETHHPEPEETHHIEPEETHHPEPEETHHPEPEETHHEEPSHHPEDSHHGEPEPTLSLPPDPEAAPSDEPCGLPLDPAGTAEVDLQAFYDTLLFDDPDFNATAELFGEYLDVYYPGLSAIPVKQLVVYQPMISAVVCEIALVEVEDSADVIKVIGQFQARIDAQVGTEDEPGGAWYPASIESWRSNSRIVSHGRYIMLIAYDKCDDVAAAFDALF